MWLKSFLMRVFRVPVRIHIHRIEPAPDRLPDIDRQDEAMADIFALVPGLQREWHNAMNQVIESMAKTPATDAYHGERIRLCERAVGLWNCLELPNKARDSYNRRQKPIEEMTTPEPIPMIN